MSGTGKSKDSLSKDGPAQVGTKRAREEADAKALFGDLVSHVVAKIAICLASERPYIARDIASLAMHMVLRAYHTHLAPPPSFRDCSTDFAFFLCVLYLCVWISWFCFDFHVDFVIYPVPV